MKAALASLNVDSSLFESSRLHLILPAIAKNGVPTYELTAPGIYKREGERLDVKRIDVEAEKRRLAEEDERLKMAQTLEAQGFKDEANAVLEDVLPPQLAGRIEYYKRLFAGKE